MVKIFIIGSSSKLARKFIFQHKLQNVSFFCSYNKNNRFKLLTKKKFKEKSIYNLVKIDLTNYLDIKKISKNIINFKPDIIINFSSKLSKRKSIKKNNFKNLFQSFNVNFFSQFNLYSNICDKLNNMAKKTLIINISSKVITNGGYKLYDYSTSKAATANLLKCLSREFKKIKFINLVMPSVKEKHGKNSVSLKKFVNKLSHIIKYKNKLKNYKTEMIKL